MMQEDSTQLHLLSFRAASFTIFPPIKKEGYKMQMEVFNKSKIISDLLQDSLSN